MRSDYPLTIFYDASCPVCALEMDQLRSRDAAGRLVLVDMSEPDFDAAHHELEPAEIDAMIHAMRPDGSVVRGMAVLRLAYAAAGLGWILSPTAAAPLKPIFDAAYRVFARHRKPISRALAPLIGLVRETRARRALAEMTRCGAACPPPGALGSATCREQQS